LSAVAIEIVAVAILVYIILRKLAKPGPRIEPVAQPTEKCKASWRVTVARSMSAPQTLTFDFGDGHSETASISQGSGTETVFFTHTFDYPLIGGSEETGPSGPYVPSYEAFLESRDPRDLIDVGSRGLNRVFVQRASVGASHSEAITVHAL